MADLVSLTIDVDTRKVVEATGDLGKLGNQAQSSSTKVDKFGKSTKRTTEHTTRFNTAINKLRGAVGLLSAGIAGVGIVSLAQQVERATTQMNNINATMTVAAGSAQAAGQQLSFIRRESERLGLFFPTMAKQMAQFAAAARSSTITGAELEMIFTGIAEASRAMGLTAPQAEGAMLALQQMMSKGKVSAEELRQQLGERMPGSIQIMANAIGVTTQKLFEMMENGELLAEEVLPKFGREMSRVFGAAAEVQANKIAAAIQRLRNSFFDLMAQDTLTGATQAIDELARVVGSDGFQRNFDNLVQMFSKLAGVIARNLDVIAALGASLAGLAVTKITAGIAALTGSFTSLIGQMVATTAASVALIGKLQLLQAVVLRLAGPAGIVAGAVSALLVFKGASKETRLESSFLELSLEEIDERMQNIKTSANEAGLATLQMMQKSAQPGFEQFIRDSKAIAELQREIADFAPEVERIMEESGTTSVRFIQSRRELEKLQERLKNLIETRNEFADDVEAYTRLQSAIEETQEKMSRLADSAINTEEEFNDLENQTISLMENLFPERRALNEYLNGLALIESALEQDILTTKEAVMARRALNEEYQNATSPDFGGEDEADDLQNISNNLSQILAQYDPIVAAATEYANQMGAVQKAVDAGIISQQKASQVMSKIEEQFNNTINPATGLQKVLEDVGSVIKDDISNGLTDIIMQAESAKDVFQSLLDTIARTLIQQQVVNPFISSIGASLPTLFGGGGSAAAGASASQMQSMSFLPQNANGGNVYGGAPSIVGERGPEIFVPRQDGQIVPNHRMGGGGDVTVNIINQGGERLETQQQQQRRGPNGEMTVDIMVKSSMERLDAQGQLDGIFRRHGAQRQGQF